MVQSGCAARLLCPQVKLFPCISGSSGLAFKWQLITTLAGTLEVCICLLCHTRTRDTNTFLSNPIHIFFLASQQLEKDYCHIVVTWRWQFDWADALFSTIHRVKSRFPQGEKNHPKQTPPLSWLSSWRSLLIDRTWVTTDWRISSQLHLQCTYPHLLLLQHTVRFSTASTRLSKFKMAPKTIFFFFNYCYYSTELKQCFLSLSTSSHSCTGRSVCLSKCSLTAWDVWRQPCLSGRTKPHPVTF